MTKAIFTTKVTPVYDDLPEQRYHFPKTYLRKVESARGDWIIYYEPRRPTGDLSSTGGRQAYFATARVVDIISDRTREDHYYALVEDYLQFDHAVPFSTDNHYYEAGLAKEDGSTNKGAFGRAVRNISDAEYSIIVQSGFAHILVSEKADSLNYASKGEISLGSRKPEATEFEADYTQEIGEYDRPIIEQLVRRPFRDRAFASTIKSAYRDTCAMTGLKIINGGGRSEVQAAHIRPVNLQGPDSVRNGLALSGTMHWMFDRGLLSVDDNYCLLIAERLVPDNVQRLLVPNGKLVLPERMDQRPHPQFLEFHRTTIFKG